MTGVVGVNGAGKSTLMRSVAGILPPSKGRIVVEGRVSTLLALGVGFNKDLSGRENVVLGGLAAGLRRDELAEKYDEITEFAELGDFMDLPMRTYSSGMYGRLAFSVAVNMDPDILLVDEALSVGDARFKKKSFERMQELCAQARHDPPRQPRAAQRRAALRPTSPGCTTASSSCSTTPPRSIEAYTRFMDVGDVEVALEDV